MRAAASSKDADDDADDVVEASRVARVAGRRVEDVAMMDIGIHSEGVGDTARARDATRESRRARVETRDMSTRVARGARDGRDGGVGV